MTRTMELTNRRLLTTLTLGRLRQQDIRGQRFLADLALTSQGRKAWLVTGLFIKRLMSAVKADPWDLSPPGVPNG